MAKLFEYQGKELLRKGGITTPEGRCAATKEAAAEIARELGRPVVVKAQTWTTGRAQSGGVNFADSADEAAAAARNVLGMQIKGFNVAEVLIEEKLDIDREFYLGMIIDDAAQCPVLIFSSRGGTGIEEIAKDFPDSVVKYPIDIAGGLKRYDALDILRRLEIRGDLQKKLASSIVAFYRACRSAEARSAEINPLVLTKQGQIVAADCHMVIDDYAVFRHPELGIEIAREFDRPATLLEKVAYQVEAKDHRGTFYFFQMQQAGPGNGAVGFHGAGGGGSMMSMDALTNKGFRLANFCDTSGNPSASKVYRAARIILSQKNIEAYFASGSGVASQEQYHSARGLVKAFREVGLSIPAIIRLGGNSEELAIEILHAHTKDLPGKVEAYGRNTSAAACAERLRQMVDSRDYSRTTRHTELHRPEVPSAAYSFATITGTIHIHHEKCADCAAKPCIEACTPQILKTENGGSVLTISADDAKKGKCTECLACEQACEFHGNGAIYIELPIPGLDEAVKSGE